MTDHAPQWTTRTLGTGVIIEHAVTLQMVDDEEALDLPDGVQPQVNPVTVPLRVSYLTSPYAPNAPGEVGLLYVHLPQHADDDSTYVAFEHYNGALCLYYITEDMRDTEKIVLIPDTTKLKKEA